MSSPSADLIARFKKMKFVPDKRSEGWWTTNLIKNLVKSKDQVSDCVMLCVIRDLLGKEVLCRYRVYYVDLTIFMLSVREEYVENVYEALKTKFEHVIPTSDHFEETEIFWEHVPNYIELYEVLNKFLMETDSRNVLAQKTFQTQEQLIKYNFMKDIVEHVAQRFLIDFPERETRDDLLKKIFRAKFSTNPSDPEKSKWVEYQNVWMLTEKIEELSPRENGETSPLIPEYYPITEDQYLLFIADHSDDLDEIEVYHEQIDDSLMIVPNNTTDNDFIRNIDLVRGRGIYLGHSHTYQDWSPNVKSPMERFLAKLAAEAEKATASSSSQRQK